MRICRIGLAVVLLAGCGSIRDLSPDKAAARISSYDSYKAEACEIMQAYLNRYEAYKWEAAEPLEPLPAGEVEHMAAVFANHPDVTCRVKAGKFFYDITGRAFGDIAKVLSPLQTMYADLGPGESIAGCTDCAVPSVSLSNGYLVAYFRRPPFPALKKKHAEAFTALCTDPEHLAENEAKIAAHDTHDEQPGQFNPLYESHGGCATIWRRALADAGRCSRYGFTHYLICPNGVWDTHTDTPKPFSAYTAYSGNEPFASGFSLDLGDGKYDVYWLKGPDSLTHEVVELAPGEHPTTDDFDGNGKADLHAGDVIVLSETSGTGRRMSVREFNANVAAKDFARRYAANIGTWSKLPLDAVENMLVSTDFKNPFLLERAAELSAAWLADAQHEQRNLLEQVQIFWHAFLWNTLSPKQPPDAKFWDRLKARTAPDAFDARQKSLVDFRKNSKTNALYDGCIALRKDMRTVLDDLNAVVSGSEAADTEIGLAYKKYLEKPLPVAEARAALAAAKKNSDSLEAYLATICL